MLKIENLYVQFGETPVISGLSLEVKAGEKVGIIGPNGSGKTTLFNCVGGYVRASSGSIYFKECDITRLLPAKRAELGMGRLFQNFGIFREMSVLENVIVALESKERAAFFPWSRQHQKNKRTALELLEKVGLADKARHKAGTLSGGQLRLLEMTRLIAFGADLFLLDEPTAGVSPKMKSEIEQAVANLQSMHRTVIIIEHDINFIERLADRIVVLDVGQVVLDDTPENVRHHPLLQEIYFGSANSSAKRPMQRASLGA